MQIQLFLSLKVKFKYSCGNFKPSRRSTGTQSYCVFNNFIMPSPGYKPNFIVIK